jgi:hypothetical protein
MTSSIEGILKQNKLPYAAPIVFMDKKDLGSQECV